MSFIHCPYCQSANIKQTESGHPHEQYFEQLRHFISPAQMALFGIKIAKKTGAPPLAGAVVGVVIGGVLVMVSQYYFERHYGNAMNFICQDCQQHFAWAKPS